MIDVFRKMNKIIKNLKFVILPHKFVEDVRSLDVCFLPFYSYVQPIINLLAVTSAFFWLASYFNIEPIYPIYKTFCYNLIIALFMFPLTYFILKYLCKETRVSILAMSSVIFQTWFYTLSCFVGVGGQLLLRFIGVDDALRNLLISLIYPCVIFPYMLYLLYNLSNLNVQLNTKNRILFSLVCFIAVIIYNFLIKKIILNHLEGIYW